MSFSSVLQQRLQWKSFTAFSAVKIGTKSVPAALIFFDNILFCYTAKGKNILNIFLLSNPKKTQNTFT
jgi:hypothetical protein